MLDHETLFTHTSETAQRIQEELCLMSPEEIESYSRELKKQLKADLQRLSMHVEEQAQRMEQDKVQRLHDREVNELKREIFVLKEQRRVLQEESEKWFLRYLDAMVAKV